MELAIARRHLSVANVYEDRPIILWGTRQVLTALDQLDDLRRRSGQQNDLSTDLPLLLSRHDSYRRRLVVVLLSTDGVLSAAVIFAERCILGRGIGLLRSGDQTGDGAVVAPQAERKQALLAACRVLLQQRRCHTVAASLEGLTSGEAQVPDVPGLFTESTLRCIRRRLPLGPTLDETLRQRFTPKKRKNLLYYYRTLSKSPEIEFIPDVPLAEAGAALLQLSRHSWPDRTAAEIESHCHFLKRHPESFCMGIRIRSGQWLSLITGWRTGSVTHLPWQLNHEEHKRASLMQVMRTYLIEHECRLGQTALNWVGGTVSFRTACEPESCLDLIQLRPGLRSGLLRHVVAPFLYRKDPSSFADGSFMLFLPPHRRQSSTAVDLSS